VERSATFAPALKPTFLLILLLLNPYKQRESLKKILKINSKLLGSKEKFTTFAPASTATPFDRMTAIFDTFRVEGITEKKV